MIQKIKKTIVLAMATVMLSVPGALPLAGSVAYADNAIADNVCKGAQQAGGSSGQGTSCGSNGGSLDISGIAQDIVNIFSIIVGAVAVIMIIYGGFRYITSGGDQNAVGSAKSTLIYAIVGLIVVALAQVIVHFVLNTTNNSISG